MERPLTIKQAAEQFNISPRTLYALCAAKKLPHVRVGMGRGTIRIMPTRFAEFLRQQEQVETEDLLS